MATKYILCISDIIDITTSLCRSGTLEGDNGNFWMICEMILIKNQNCSEIHLT